jgi:hypothetical protein
MDVLEKTSQRKHTADIEEHVQAARYKIQGDEQKDGQTETRNPCAHTDTHNSTLQYTAPLPQGYLIMRFDGAEKARSRMDARIGGRQDTDAGSVAPASVNVGHNHNHDSEDNNNRTAIKANALRFPNGLVMDEELKTPPTEQCKQKKHHRPIHEPGRKAEKKPKLCIEGLQH